MSSVGEIASPAVSGRSIGRLGLSWAVLLGAAAFVLALLSGAVHFDPDTYWQIVTGRWILAHGSVPTHDIFSFTRHGARWVAQEWGAELLVALVYGRAGWAGLMVLAALSFGLTIAYLARFLLSRMEPLHAVLFTVFAGCMMFNYIIVRPHELAWPLTAVWFGTLIRSSEAKRAPPWWLPGVMLLWANLHGSFILGLALAPVIGLEALSGAKPNCRPAAWRWGTFLAAAFGCALLNPQGWRLLVFPFHLLGMPVLGRLTEWQPPNLQHPQVFGLWLLVVFGLSFAGRFRLPPARSLMLTGLIYFALQHVRNVSLLGLISPFLIATPLAALWRRQPVRGQDAQGLDRWFGALAAPARVRAVCATLVLAGALGIAIVSVQRPRPPAQFTPRAALDALLAKRPQARIFDDANFGGYLIFRGVPVFVDPRVTVYGDAFLRRYFDALELSPQGHVRALLARYRIDAILLGPEWPMVRVLDRLPGWKRAYADKVAVVYLRRGGPGA